MDCGCAPMFRFFSVTSDGATTERQIQNRVFWSISYQFEEGWRRQLCIDLYAFFAACQRTRCAWHRTKRYVVLSVGGATRFANLRRKFSKTKKKSAAELCQILRMVTVDIVINSTRVMGVRVTISCRYALSSRGRCFCFQFVLFFVTLRVRSAVRSRGAQFEHVLRCRLQVDFDAVCNVFFGRDCSFRQATQF